MHVLGSFLIGEKGATSTDFCWCLHLIHSCKDYSRCKQNLVFSSKPTLESLFGFFWGEMGEVGGGGQWTQHMTSYLNLANSNVM